MFKGRNTEKMKGSSSKSISSPRRTEKFPPPLMRFLRSNAGSKSSRGRSTRSSPMFMRKNKDNIIFQTTTQEPSSPKVTCIGQVRVRRRSSNRRTNKKRKQRRGEGKCRCYSNFTILKIVKLHRPKSLISNLKKWVCCFGLGKKVESTQKVVEIGIFESERVDGYADSNSNSNSNSNPPKNALILTRCRSAPYRSSSLASKFWGSPLNHNIREPEEEEEKPPPPPPLPVLEKPIMPEGIIGDLGSEKSRESEEMQSFCINEESSKGNCNVHPLLLTRCKSEPARTGERLNPIWFSETNPPS